MTWHDRWRCPGSAISKTEARIGPHRLLVDEPVDKGGEDTGPTPTETVLAALGA